MSADASGHVVTGDLEAFSIFDITQSLMMGRKTARVVVNSGDRRGFVHFKGGAVVSATDDNYATGEKAAMRVFSWTKGQFRIEPDVEPDTVDIRVPTDHLLMEVARNIDEIRRDQGEAPEGLLDDASTSKVEEEVSTRFGDKLRNELTGVFRQVAGDTVPARDRYTARSFDPVLSALLDLEGTALFLRAGQSPRIKGERGFSTIRDDAIAHEEIEGFLGCVLSEREHAALKEQKEVTTFFTAPELGAFRLAAYDEHGSVMVTFTPCGLTAPTLSEYEDEGHDLSLVRQFQQGLVIVAGPMGSGKAALVTAIIEERLEADDLFAFSFTNTVAYSVESDRGFCVRRAVPPKISELTDGVRGALEQGAELLSLSNVPEATGLALGLAASRLGRRVLLTLESNSTTDTARRILQALERLDDPDLRHELAKSLVGVLDLTPGPQGRPSHIAVRQADRDWARAISEGSLDGLLSRAPLPTS